MAGRVIYTGYEHDIPVGGNRIITEHVALLHAAGIEAYRWSPTPGFRYTWFDDTVPTLSGTELDLGADDMVIVPELTVLPGRDPAPGGRKVILSQAHFMTFVTCPDLNPYPGWSVDPALWTISRNGVDVLKRAIPNLPTPTLVPNPVAVDLFRPAPHRTRSIAWMSRKRPSESALLKQLLRADPRSDGVELRDIRGVPYERVAEIMTDTSVFIALGSPEGEGFGLPIAEALSAGCLVTGYGLGGGDELFEAPAAWRVPDLQTVQLADRALELLDLPDADRVREAGRQWVTERYGPKITTDALVAAVEATRRLPGQACRAVHPDAWQAELMAILAPYAAPLQAAGIEQPE